MEIDCLPFRKTGYFSKLICDYIEEKETLTSLYGQFPKLENFERQIREKKANFSVSVRKTLVKSLEVQYEDVKTSSLTSENIQSLHAENTFTVTTGHQLNLFTGPLYFLYKIVSTINLAKVLKETYGDYNFVPVYWMATEDHDFEEINYFNFKGKKIQWNKNATGAVGHLSTEGLDEVFEIFSNAIGGSKNADYLKNLFTEAYLKHKNLTRATRYLANELFKEQGLVIVDGDDHHLKELLVPYVKKDLFEQVSFTSVSKKISEIQQMDPEYGIQVNPREINYFYLKNGIRERIVERDGKFYINDTQLSFTKEELLEELQTYPERFSPNVVARPLYQEVILPNLCYIGGGGELAYWLQLKASFQAMEVPFPILLLRNSVLIITEKQDEKLDKLNISHEDIFLKRHSLINKKIREVSNIDIDFSPQKKFLEEQFKGMYDLAEQTDKSFLGAVKAQEVKQKKGLDKLEKRLLKAQKRKLEDHVVRLTDIQNQLFPGQSLQERQLNFSELYLEYGEELIPMLLKHLNPLDLNFMVLSIK